MLPATWERARGLVERALESTHQKTRDIEVGAGRVIIRSPNGTRYAITVSNAGVLGATAL